MKDFKGTPGPWFWNDEGLGNDCLLVFGRGYPAEMASKENKLLIAAAPDLLESLQEVTGSLAVMVGDADNCPEILKARAAISKALGEE